jgi:sugar/nucleoside kinase (ribokinase family)
MANFLASVLTNDHPLFVRNLFELERASGGNGVDTRLIADMREKAFEIMRSLGLDPADTSPYELYQALNTIVEQGKLTLLESTSYVLLPFEDGPVSFNQLDIIENAHHHLAYEQRRVDHAQRHLRQEVIRRYAIHDRTNNELVHLLAQQAGLIKENDMDHDVADAVLNNELAENDQTQDAPSMLAIGDIFTDAFIKLSESVANVTKDEDGKSWIHIPFGGRPPYEEVEIVQSVGPAPNSAVSFARLGLRSGLMSWLGDDEPGNQSLAYLSSQNVDTSLVTQKTGEKSNYYYVLRLGAERTILTKDEKYDYVWTDPSEQPDWIYLASVSEDAAQLQDDMLAYLERNPSTSLAFQPGTFHFHMDKEKLAALFRRSRITLMNREEAVDMTGAPYDSITGLVEALHALGPEIVVITDGPNGSYASYDGRLMTIPNYPDPAPPYDRTGAGDAFASTIVSALALGETMETALTWAPINSMNVVQHLGAQAGLLTKQEIQEYVTKAPGDYKVTEFKD